MTMADDNDDDVPSMESLIQDLSSSSLNAASRPKRNEVIQIASERVKENENDRKVLAAKQGERASHFLRQSSTSST